MTGRGNPGDVADHGRSRSHGRIVTCNRRVIERELTAEEIEVLQQWARDLGLHSNGWHYVPGLARFLEVVAVERHVTRAQHVHGDLSRRGALELAAARVGVRPRSHARRLLRWREKVGDELSPTGL